MLRYLLRFPTLVLLLICGLEAGVGGKLSGRIVNEIGEPLIGANVMVNGTALGAATDVNGQYYILNIPPAVYIVRISMIGYKTYRHVDIQVVSDLTTTLNATLEQTVLEAEEVTITAERPLIRKDITSSVVVITGDDIMNMPVADFKDVLATQAGFTRDEEGALHVRGGRAREILYIVDGMVIKDPIGGDFTGVISQNAIQELTVISGTFNAEYGEAMSSVVNIVTREGGDKFAGRMEYLSDFMGQSPYHAPNAFGSVNDSNFVYAEDLGDQLIEYYNNSPTGPAYPTDYPGGGIPLLNLGLGGTSNLTFSGPLPLPRTTFFFSAYSGNRRSHLPHGANLDQDMQLKLTTRISPQFKISTQLQSSIRLWQKYRHKWKYLPYNQAHNFRSTNRLSLSLTHSPSQSLFYTLSMWRLGVGRKTAVRGLLPDEYVIPNSGSSIYFYTSGNSPEYTINKTITDGVRLDLTTQLNQFHQIKTGFTVKQHDLDLYTEKEPWESGVNFKNDTTFVPVEGAFYIQNKIEYEYIILNVGVRYDYLDPKAAMWEDIEVFGSRDENDNWIEAPVVDVKPQKKWSPRIGISYPATDKTVFHFSYGHFLQFPNFDAITYNAANDIEASLPLVGNPRVKAQKTVAFETGIKHSLSKDAALSVTAWTKDIRDLLSTQQIRYLSRQYIVYTNTDYASVKGIDLLLQLRGRGGLGGTLGYSLSIAKGNNSDPMGGYFSAYTMEEIPHQEYYLNFDQRHDFSLNLNWSTPSAPGLKGIFGDMVSSLLVTAGSGLPYTPYVDPTIRVPVNSARKPWTFNADIRINKRLIKKPVAVELMVEITNLTNQRNVIDVYSRTGKPFDPGGAFVGTSVDGNYNPAHIGAPRMIKAGFDVNW